MYLSAVRAVLLCSGLAAAFALPVVDLEARQTTAKCVSGVHIIVARGTTEAPGEGSMGAVADMIVKQIPDSNSIGLRYPASFNPTYQKSEQAGRRNMTRYIKQYVASCPDTRIVLLGYSQGAQVIGDTICGNSEAGFTQTAPLQAFYAKHIAAVVWFGDPSHVPGEPWDFGTSKRDGVFPRRNNTACDPYADRLRSWCDHRDIFCDSGSSLEVHFEYVNKYGKTAANYVVQKVSKAASAD